MKRPIVLMDAVHNAAKPSGASDEYVKGVLMGCVAGMMATGMTFKNALAQVAIAWPDTKYEPRELLPESWMESFRAEISKRKRD